MADRPKRFRPGKRAEPKPRYVPKAKQAKTAERGYGAKWREAAKAFLQINRLCAECLRNNRYTMAECVDHIRPHKGDHGLFWDRDNWQPLCARCHGKKTRKEQRGEHDDGR